MCHNKETAQTKVGFGWLFCWICSVLPAVIDIIINNVLPPPGKQVTLKVSDLLCLFNNLRIEELKSNSWIEEM
jgi:hypothetical protein